MTIQKSGTLYDWTSSLQSEPVAKVKTTLPQDLQIRLLADQSVFVRGAISEFYGKRLSRHAYGSDDSLCFLQLAQVR